MKAESPQSLWCERGSRNVVSLCDWPKATILTFSALLYKTHTQTHKQAHKRQVTHSRKHACKRARSCIFKCICKHTQSEMDRSVTVVTIQAAITVTGRTFN